MTAQFHITGKAAFGARAAALRAQGLSIAGGLLNFYSRPVPTDMTVGATSGILASGALAAPCLIPFAATCAGKWGAVGVAAGVAVSFRIIDSGGMVRVQGTVSGPGGGGDMIVSDPSVVVGGLVRIVYLVVPASEG